MSSVGRNDPCPCGSGKKYKQCCGRSDPVGVTAPIAPIADRVGARYNRAVSLQLQGALDDAIRAYRDVLAQVPEHIDARYNLAIALASQGRRDDAIASYRSLLERRPDFAEARSNLGLLLHAEDRLEEAIDCYRTALAIKPNAWVYNNLGNAFDEMGRIDDAVSSYRRALELSEAPEIQINFARSAKHLDKSDAYARLRTLVARAMAEAWTRPSDLSRAAIKLIRGNPTIDACIERAARAWPNRLDVDELFGNDGLPAVGNDPLLLSLLENAPVCDVSIERFLTMARRALLDDALATVSNDPDPATLAFYCALARQCFLNEYVFICEDLEVARNKSLQQKIDHALEANEPVPTLRVVAAAAYASLSDIPSCARFLEREWQPSIAAILVQQITEPAQERRHRETIDRKTAIDDPVSAQVRQQYEENPYPRWDRLAIASKAEAFNAQLRRQFPHAAFEPLASDRNIDVLIAGCGTGQETLETARQIAGARVLAIDLSIASLAYAKRKTIQAGIGNVEYAQADILNAASLNRRFDVIASVGVLHHLADPLAGWRALLSLLRPGGFMRIGLYSERARRDVVAARAFIAERGYSASSTTDIRRARQDLVADDSSQLARIASLRDFYTISECRDLLFHVQEHRYTLSAIKEAIATLDLCFVGFLLEPHVVHAYKTCFPHDRSLTDLDAWNSFEAQYPDTFTGMYRFWVQKPR